MKTVEKLVRAMRDGKKHMKLGNHRMEQENGIVRFIYHDTAICTLNRNNGVFYTNNGGWDTQSTNRAINAYKCSLGCYGYKLVDAGNGKNGSLNYKNYLNTVYKTA